MFLGLSKAIVLTGSSVLVGYLISGIAIFLIMRQLGEMDTEEPMAGSFSYFAYKYWGESPVFSRLELLDFVRYDRHNGINCYLTLVSYSGNMESNFIIFLNC
ncbi:hypothetical protein AGMMS49990_00370 [Endomicrobiia bacterium]|nr:hypothetical protein AGMMS49990_00370 [Endomicrobiia bacterium]